MPAAPSASHPDLPGLADPHSMLRDSRRLDIDTRRRRLLFRCWHCGTQEADLLFGSFAETSLAGFEVAQLDRFEALLECADADWFDRMTGCIASPTE